ncbi:hypothetical protein NUW54_g12769 [Trametes sanguinea]|uniref:Uncharacterized protein n=1 Tax=Trametes sanguinea TaxID=158606 RepID=A0ACC1MUH4_9APHY|nr:hypothetical protein NUW54_g12769 [Trametes sanguinea]
MRITRLVASSAFLRVIPPGAAGVWCTTHRASSPALLRVISIATSRPTQLQAIQECPRDDRLHCPIRAIARIAHTFPEQNRERISVRASRRNRNFARWRKESDIATETLADSTLHEGREQQNGTREPGHQRLGVVDPTHSRVLVPRKYKKDEMVTTRRARNKGLRRIF